MHRAQRATQLAGLRNVCAYFEAGFDGCASVYRRLSRFLATSFARSRRLVSLEQSKPPRRPHTKPPISAGQASIAALSPYGARFVMI